MYGHIILAVFSYFLVALFVSIWSFTQSPFYLVDGEFTPEASYHGNNFVLDTRKWCVLIAGKDFLSKSEHDRLAYAEDYFNRYIAAVAKECGYDVRALRDWFFKHAVRNVEALPIDLCSPDPNNTQRDVLYCDIDIREKPGVEFWRFVIRPEILKVSLLFFVIIYGPLALLFTHIKNREEERLIFEKKEL